MRPGPGAVALCPPLAPVIGHRGAAARAPENTLAGLRRAKDLGCSWVEFDVRLTGDGALVLCHDARLDRTTTGQGRVSAHRLSAIRCFDAGAWFAPEFAGGAVPTLEEALLVAAELGLSVNIEIRPEDMMDAPEFSGRGGIVKARALFGARLPAMLDELTDTLVA